MPSVFALAIKFFLKTYGCTLNQADSDAIRSLLLQSGCEEASEQEADVLMLNTCTVKRATEQKIFQEIKRLNAMNKPIVLAGCLASAMPKKLEKLAPAASLLGPRATARACEVVHAQASGKKLVVLEELDKSSLPFVSGGFFARIPIAEGCVSACTFCQTRIARGNLSSRPIESIVQDVEKAVSLGAFEIQLTAQDIGAYGIDLGISVISLFKAISAVPGDFRVRIGMCNPDHAQNNLSAFEFALSNDKFYKFLHLPAQSGDDGVLSSMARTYSVVQFEKLVSDLREICPDLTLSTDIITGFPTESHEAFLATLELLERVRFDVVNVSRFTPRPGTPADKMPQLPNTIINDRTRECARLCRKISLEKNEAWIGREFSVRVLEKLKTPVGRNDFYKPVAVPGAKLGALVKVKATGASTSCVLSKIL